MLAYFLTLKLKNCSEAGEWQIIKKIKVCHVISKIFKKETLGQKNRRIESNVC